MLFTSFSLRKLNKNFVRNFSEAHFIIEIESLTFKIIIIIMMKCLHGFMLFCVILTYFFLFVNSACVNDLDCNNGECKNKTYCKCDDGYTTHGTDAGPCNYKQKNKLTAFMLSFFIGNTGADWFYLAEGNGGKLFFLVKKLFIIIN